MDLGYLKIRNKEVFVSKKFLLDNFFTRRFLEARLDKIDGEGSTYYTFFVDNKSGEPWINYSSIPRDDLRKHGLPTKTKRLVDILSNAIERTPGKFSLSLLFTFNIIWYVKQHWAGYVPYYVPYYFDDPVKYKLAKTHAIIRYILDLKRRKDYTVEVLYHTYMQLPNVYYKRATLYSFYRKLREFEQKGIPETLMHSFKVNGRGPYKVKPFIVALIKKHAFAVKRYKPSLIHKLVNLELTSIGKDKISRGSVVRILKNPEFINLFMFPRNGKAYTESNLLPFNNRVPVEEVGILYEMDGKDLHIKCQKENEVIRLQMFVVRDVYSGKIVGYDFQPTENTIIVRNALKMAFKQGGIIPMNIVYDKHPVSKSDIYKTLKQRFLDYGVHLRECRAYNPRGKGTLENWFKFFGNNHLALIKGYLGSGIKAKTVGARADNALEKFYLLKNEISSHTEIIKKVTRQIKKYNSEVQEGKVKSPNAIFNAAKKKNTRRFDEKDIALLFGEEVRRTIKQQMVFLEIDGHRYSYTISDRKLGNKTNGTKVNVFYHRFDPSRIQIFSLKYEFLGSANLDVAIHQVAKTEEETEIRQALYMRNINHVVENIEELYDSFEEGELLQELETDIIIDTNTKNELDELKKEDMDLTRRYLTRQKPYGKAIARMLERREYSFLKYEFDDSMEIEEIEPKKVEWKKRD